MQTSSLTAGHLVIIAVSSTLSPCRCYFAKGKFIIWQIITKNKYLDDSIHFAPYYAFNYFG